MSCTQMCGMQGRHTHPSCSWGESQDKALFFPVAQPSLPCFTQPWAEEERFCPS